MDELPRSGDIFAAKYKIIKLLGTGGNGAVFQALQLDCQRIIAIKIILPKFANDEDFRNRFLREARSLSQIRHANVIIVYHVGITENQFLYLAMEYVEGVTLRDKLKELGKLPLKAAINISVQCARALVAMHALGIIHRDLKPDNLLLVQNPEPDTVKIIDFGLAKSAKDSTITSDQEILGTFSYMSPEQCKALKADPRSDVYALSICFYEMLTGELPFQASSPVALAGKHISAQIPTIAPGQIENFRPVLNKFFSKGMAKDPSMRFQDMEAMETALLGLEDGSWDEHSDTLSAFGNSRKIQISTLVAILLISTAFFLAAALLERNKQSLQTNSTKQSSREISHQFSLPNHKVTLSEACFLCAKIDKLSQAKRDEIINKYLSQARLDPRAKVALLIYQIEKSTDATALSSSADALKIIRTINSKSNEPADNNLYLHCLFASLELNLRLGNYSAVDSICSEAQNLSPYSFERRLPAPIGNHMPDASDFALGEIKAALALHDRSHADELMGKLLRSEKMATRLLPLTPILLELKRYDDLNSIIDRSFNSLSETVSLADHNVSGGSPKSRMWMARELCASARQCIDASQFKLGISCADKADQLLTLMRDLHDYGDVDADFARLHLVCRTQKAESLLALGENEEGKAEVKSVYGWFIKECGDDKHQSNAQNLNSAPLLYLLERLRMQAEADNLIALVTTDLASNLSFAGTIPATKSPAYWVTKLEPYCKSDARLNVVVEELRKMKD